MAPERPPGTIKFMFRIKMQHHSCDFAPVGAVHIRVEQAHIRDEMLLVTSGQYGIGGRGIGDIGIKRRRLHERFSQQIADRSILRWPPWHIDDRTREVRFALDSVAKLQKRRATNFPWKDGTSDNRRSMQPQTRYRNRL
jgi:hypothetical protein